MAESITSPYCHVWLAGVPRELLGKTREELRFWRLIEEVEPDGTGISWVVRLGCGHTSTWVTEPVVTYAPCAQCVNEWMKAEKRMKDGLGPSTANKSDTEEPTERTTADG